MAKQKKAPDAYYIVRGDDLPEVFLKVMEVKRLLDQGRARSVNEAVKKVGISRSAYYKYRKSIRALKTIDQGAITAVLIVMEHLKRVAPLCFDTFFEAGAEILSFLQSPPVDGLVHVLVTYRTDGNTWPDDVLIYRLTQTRGVVHVQSLRQT